MMGFMRCKQKDGFVLMVALPLFLIVFILLGSVFSYVGFNMHSTARYMTITQDRLAAQTAIELCKNELSKEFRSFYRKRAASNLRTTMAWWDGSEPFTIVNKVEQRMSGDTDLKLEFKKIETKSTFSGGIVASVTYRIKATAKHNTLLGTPVSRSLTEDVRLVMNKSTVTDYALFVNGPGAFGSSTQALNKQNRVNGDIHANGSMNIINPSSQVNGATYGGGQGVINGNISAAKVKDDDIGSIWTENRYDVGNIGDMHDTRPTDFYSESWAAYQIAKYGEGNISQARPTNPINSMGESWEQGYSGTSTLMPNSAAIEMPTIDNLDLYKEVARESNATLTYTDFSSASSYTEASRNYNKDKYPKKTINAVMQSGTTGPSGVRGAADAGSLLLIGTKEHPIELNGPIVVDRDVVIRGYVKGQGGIFSGRNITVLGDITYLDPPNWRGNDTNPDSTVASNAKKDMLTLCAKGNVIIGVPERAELISFGDMDDWFAQNFFSSRTSDLGAYYTIGTGLYMNQNSFQYDTDGTASDIGYGLHFNGNYLAKDGLSRVDDVKSVYNPDTGRYETVATSAKSRFCDPLVSNSLIKAFGDYKFNHLDATIFSNNCVMMSGRIDPKLANPVEINGAVITRNMLLPKVTGALHLNWDIRLGSKSKDGAAMENSAINLCLPLAIAVPETLAWSEAWD